MWHRVAREVLFGGPKDFDKATDRPAAWYTPSATPVSSIYTFNYEQDEQGCNFEEQLRNCRAIGLGKLGAAVSVDNLKLSYLNSHITIRDLKWRRVHEIRVAQLEQTIALLIED